MDEFMLRHHRAKLIQRYRSNPSPWPDGIDTEKDRWFKGKEGEWPAEKVALWASVKWVDDQAKGNVTLAVTPEERKRLATRERVARFRAKHLLEMANSEKS